MYLKSIEIQGFKSFAHKLVFEFHNGITGIVGPNGSGKSNVADAVRWVLGEQRIKQLRGASMQDVIFAGTETRKPQGFAYVAITLDNSDHQLAIEYDQVTVSRRLYRSGESEYMINGSACRLKDINELFYDTGIGKEGYSIIGQGQIDRILSSKPEDRRELFDEAAGIVKFKRRKAVAQKKLEDEQASLVRVSDILAELEKQVGPLERQAKAAREYLQLKESLKICEANQFLLETQEVQKQLDQIAGNRQIAADDLAAVQEEARQLKADYDQIEAALKEQEETLAAQRESLSGKTVEKSSLEGRIQVLQEQIHTEELNEAHLQKRREAIDQELNGKREQLATYDEDSSLLRIQASETARRLKEMNQALAQQEEQIHQLEQAEEAEKAGIISRLNAKASLTARQQRCETMLEQIQIRRSEVSQKLLKLKSDQAFQDKQIQREEEALRQVESQLDQARQRSGQTEESIRQSEEAVHRLNRNLNNAQQQYHMDHTRLESLRNLAERYDGYGGSIRKVMETRDRIKGIHGVVADLIATEKKYETAIETALGGSIQNIVTDSEETAKRLIEYLKKNKFGRATFLPLTSMKGKQSSTQEGVLKEPGVLGLASQLVTADSAYSGLVQYLLGRVVVTDTIDNAIALARKYRYSLRIVTLDGELLNAGGSMTGGAFKNTSNLLGRRREIEELEDKCKKALVQVDQIQKELVGQERSLAGQKEQLESLRLEIQTMSLEQNTLQHNLSQVKDKKTELTDSTQDLEREYVQLAGQLEDIQGSQRQLEQETRELETANEQAGRQAQEQATALEQAKNHREELVKEQSQIQLEEASHRQKLDFAMENHRRVREEIGRLEEEYAGLEEGALNSREAVTSKKEEIQDLEKAIQRSTQAAAELEEEISLIAQKKEKMSARQKVFFERREELTGRQSDLDKELFRIQSQQEKQEERLEQLTTYMWSEYEMTFAQAQELKQEEYSALPYTKIQIHELNRKIKSLGNINVNAIEDYREISERYTFLKAQHEDLTAAQAELEKIIETLDQGMRKQFREKFREIQLEFDRVFKQLFGGGRGSLELLEDEDILEAGVQIIAQPPGKKLQNMMQLSGGEKALTAISLLFAIQNLKPSPFCLLDEIEAALDDSNVDRFAKYLHKLAKNTQFIVITHRRGTMVSADRLYGITMQEKGVSALVSVNLIEDRLDN